MWNLLIPAVTSIIDKLIPDADEAAKAKSKLLEMQVKGELDTIVGQLEINKAEASSGSSYAAGWRPTIGYICAFGLAYNFIVYPMMTWYSARYMPGFSPPPLVSDNLMELVMGMLGLAGLRSFEKFKGVSK